VPHQIQVPLFSRAFPIRAVSYLLLLSNLQGSCLVRPPPSHPRVFILIYFFLGRGMTFLPFFCPPFAERTAPLLRFIGFGVLRKCPDGEFICLRRSYSGILPPSPSALDSAIFPLSLMFPSFLCVPPSFLKERRTEYFSLSRSHP